MTIYDWLIVVGIGGLFLLMGLYLLYVMVGMFRTDPALATMMFVILFLVVAVCIGAMGQKGML